MTAHGPDEPTAPRHRGLQPVGAGRGGRRPGGGAIRGRVRYERELVGLLEAEGWRCLRSAGSRGPWDLVAVNRAEVRLIQVKTTRTLRSPTTRAHLVQAVRMLQAIAAPPTASRWLCVRVLPGGWHRECVDDYPAGRGAVRAWLSRIMAGWLARPSLAGPCRPGTGR